MTLSGCARLEFQNQEGLIYYTPKPYLFVTTSKDCVTTATVIVLPDKPDKVIFHTGYGSAELSVSLANGMITTVGQKTDTKIPETISAIASLGTAVAPKAALKEAGKEGEKKPDTCTPDARLYQIVNGLPDLTVSWPVLPHQ